MRYLPKIAYFLGESLRWAKWNGPISTLWLGTLFARIGMVKAILLEKTMRIRSCIFAVAFILALFCSSASADIRVKQKVTTSGQTVESTRSIKGSRERTEQKVEMDDPQAAAFMPQIATITQCDRRRTVRLNDRKQLYLVEPFDDSDTGPVTKTTPAPTRITTTRQGGTMTITYLVKDTGERKMMFGLQARHLIVTNEMESSADSCNGPSKSKIEYDGWYVDFSAEFNCPTARPEIPERRDPRRPDCRDRIVMKGSAARTGFLLQGTMTMFGSDGKPQMTQTTETLELSRAPLDSALFDIPAGYKQTSSQQDLYAISMPSLADLGRTDRPTGVAKANTSAKSVSLNIIYPNVQPDVRSEVEAYVRSKISQQGLRTVSGSGDYGLNIEFRQIKESTAGKIGGIFGKVTGVDTKAGKVDIDMTATLSGGANGQAKVKNRFDGPMSDGLRAAIDQALDQLLEKIEN